jgi:hypothetical protein
MIVLGKGNCDPTLNVSIHFHTTYIIHYLKTQAMHEANTPSAIVVFMTALMIIGVMHIRYWSLRGNAKTTKQSK